MRPEFSSVELITFAAVVVLVLGSVVVGLLFRSRNTRRQMEASERGIRTMLTCRLCGGPLVPCTVWSYRSTLFVRRAGKTVPIGGVCCSECGHVDLFGAVDRREF